MQRSHNNTNTASVMAEHNESFSGSVDSLLDCIHKYENSVTIISQNDLNRCLLKACSLGDLSDVQVFIQSGADLETRHDSGNTPLLTCAKNGFTDIASFLLEKGADVNASNHFEETPLILSVRLSGSLDLAKLLLKQKKIEVDRTDGAGYTALMVAIERKDIEAMQILFHGKASFGIAAEMLAKSVGFDKLFRHLKKSKNKKRTPLHKAVLESDLHSVNLLLANHFSCPADPHSRDYKIITQFLDSKIRTRCEIKDQDVAVVKTLLVYGASVKEGDGKCDHFTPLHKAVKLGSGQLVKMICDYGIDQGAEQDFTRAVAVAKATERYDLAKLLMRYVNREKKVIQRVKHNYNYAVTAALEKGHIECATTLLKQSASKNIAFFVLQAVERQILNSLKILVELEPEHVKQCALSKEIKGRDLLGLARELGNREIENLLIDLGASAGF
ncbi:unnamed protein product [Lymnaea stagnalis]|uniref:Uncharacterized protein n=1 Tax=Lymnaea stagnalis TaxID=6523 RepID=A0AAV2HMG5_LYMST